MSRLEDKLRLRYADRDAVWTGTWAGALVGATWEEADGRRLLLGVESPLVAARVVDAFVQGLDDGARHVTVAWEGVATPVARDAASRLGVDLLDATDLPLPAPPAVEAPAPVPDPVPLLAPGIVAPLLVAHRSVVPVPEPAYDVPEGLVAGLEAGALPDAWPPVRPAFVPAFDVAEGLVAALEAGALPDAWPPPRARKVHAPAYDVDEGLFPALEAALPPVTDEVPFIDPGSGVLDESLLGQVDGLVHALEDEPVLPWGAGPARPEPEVAPARVDPMEVMAMPWHHPVHALPEEHVEVLPGNARPRHPVPLLRPTQAPDWGLPWPRPVPPADALAIADPALWGARDRMRAVREDLDRAGGGSFGQVKPDGSAWLKRLQSGL